MHPRALHPSQRLGHERGMYAMLESDLAHQQPECHHAVGHGERIGVAQVDLVLGRRVLVERVLDGYAHRLERAQRAMPDVRRDVGGVVRSK